MNEIKEVYSFDQLKDYLKTVKELVNIRMMNNGTNERYALQYKNGKYCFHKGANENANFAKYPLGIASLKSIIKKCSSIEIYSIK